MNNKGFAITSIIYGLMLLFVLVITSFISILVGRNRRMDALIEGVHESVKYEEIKVCDTCDNRFTNVTYTTLEKGLYNFDDNCKIYLPKNTIVIKANNKYYYNYKETQNIEMNCIN